VRFITAALDDATTNSPALRDACAGIHTVFHVAAKVGVWGRYDDYFRANVLGTRALLASARAHGTRNFIHTSTPSVVYNGLDLAGADESLPLTTRCPSAYPLTKAIAEREVLAANSSDLRTVALRPHLIWGNGDPHLIPRVLAQARAGRLRIVGNGRNKVDMVHVENATDAHLLAEATLQGRTDIPVCPKPPNLPKSPDLQNTAQTGMSVLPSQPANPSGRAYFISNGEPVSLWDWVNDLLAALGEPRITKKISLRAASAIGACCEAAWRALPLRGEPPMTRFVAAELAKDHWFDIAAARRDLGYAPRISMEEGTKALVERLRVAR